jgi:hypothetical protein
LSNPEVTYLQLLEFVHSGIDYTSNGHEHKILIGILCLILHHSANKNLIEPAKAIILNTSLVSLTDFLVHEACAKGPSLFQYDQETSFGESLIVILLLVFFSLRRYEDGVCIRFIGSFRMH